MGAQGHLLRAARRLRFCHGGAGWGPVPASRSPGPDGGLSLQFPTAALSWGHQGGARSFLGLAKQQAKELGWRVNVRTIGWDRCPDFSENSPVGKDPPLSLAPSWGLCAPQPGLTTPPLPQLPPVPLGASQGQRPYTRPTGHGDVFLFSPHRTWLFSRRKLSISAFILGWPILSAL